PDPGIELSLSGSLGGSTISSWTSSVPTTGPSSSRTPPMATEGLEPATNANMTTQVDNTNRSQRVDRELALITIAHTLDLDSHNRPAIISPLHYTYRGVLRPRFL